MTHFQPQVEFLTPEESAQVDQALLTARDRFSARVALYSLRSLKQIAAETQQEIPAITPAQIQAWVQQDTTLTQGVDIDAGFLQFFTQLVLSSLKPLTQMAESYGVAIADLDTSQVIAWFEQEAKRLL
ncbi:MAG: hypothetical protein IGR76_14715 [Synechococcales cyanobacterium T60_A2020_003]|nr:hypothetical protein [Synechococcales cyanobacterium T60_A2020_003]